MTSRFQAFVLAALLLAGQGYGLAASNPLELKWGELAPIIAGHRVELTLTDGIQVKGEAVVVRDDALVMDVKNTTGEKAYPKGSGSVPRNMVSTIKVERTRGSWGRSIGTVIGVMAGLAVGGYVAYVTADSAGTGIPIFLGVASATAIGGYYAGRGLDKRTTLIKIVP
jgi:hypothetical protein